MKYENLKKSDVRNVEDGLTSTLLEATPRQQSGIAPAGRSVHDIVVLPDVFGRASQTTRSSARSASTTTLGATRSTEVGMDAEDSGQTAGM